jgi:hypothetical protein
MPPSNSEILLNIKEKQSISRDTDDKETALKFPSKLRLVDLKTIIPHSAYLAS